MRAILASYEWFTKVAYYRRKSTAKCVGNDGGLPMSNDTNTESRRRFLKIAAGTTMAAVVIGGLPRSARAADLPAVTEDDPTAKALGYVEVGSKSANPKHKAGDACANCMFYSGAATGRGPCQLFPGKSVAAAGWCVSHAPKAA